MVRYYKELTRYLSQNNTVFFSRTNHFLKNTNIKVPPFNHFRPHRISFYFEYLWNKKNLQKPVDIVHPTEFQLSPSGNFFSNDGSKLIITIHDLIHEKFGGPGNLYSKNERTEFYSKADGFIFVSQSTEKDFQEYYPNLFESRINEVIHHGCNIKIINGVHLKSENQFLYVGSRCGYKNFEVVAKSFCELVKTVPCAKLVIAGSPPSEPELKLFLCCQDRITWVKNPADLALEKLYADSIALLYLSKYEGFGMPLLEAMSQRCIPIAGNHSSIVEVLGNAGLKVDCNSVKDIVKLMIRICNDSNFTNHLAELGLERVKTFEWSKSASQTLGFYEKVLLTSGCS